MNESDPLKDDLSTVSTFSVEQSKLSSKNSLPIKSRKWPVLCLLLSLTLVALAILAFTHLQSSSPQPLDPVEPEETSPKQPVSQVLSTIFFEKSKMQAPIIRKTPRGNYRNRVLCQILNNTNCQSNFIADSIDLFWVIAPLYNFDQDIDWRYYERHEGFKSYVKAHGIPFITIEAIRFPDNQTQRLWSREPTTYSATVPNNEPYDIQVYYYNMSYIRENLLNVAIRKLDKLASWEYAVWIDAHQVFHNSYWWEESIYKSEKFGSVQLFDSVSYLKSDNKSYYQTFSIIRMSLFVNQINVQKISYGNAYAINRDNYNKIGFIYDECISTHCDCAYSLASFPDGVGFNIAFPNLYKNFETWINNTKNVFQGKRAYIRGHLHHLFHAGSFPYGELSTATEKYGFNSSTDISRDYNFSIFITNKEVATSLDWIIFDTKRKSAQIYG